MNWVTSIEKARERQLFLEKYQLEESQVLFGEEGLSFLLKQEQTCSVMGWDEQAFFAYLEYIKEIIEIDSGRTQELLEKSSEEIYLVGSTLYTKMFKKSGLSSLEKIRMVLTQMGCVLDKHDFLQANGCRFDPMLPPHSKFLEEFAECVKRAYPRGLIAAENPTISKEELKVVHQFRHLIDYHNLLYIRSNFSGMTDYDKLVNYAKKTNQTLLYRDTSRFHNRVGFSGKTMRNGRRQKKPLERPVNDKIKTANGLSEFIVNVEDGHFVSQWNQLKTWTGLPLFLEEEGKIIGLRNELINSNPKDYDLSGVEGKEIADTESFNYDRGFFDWLPWRRNHERFDMKPGGQEKFDSVIRKQAKKRWAFPDPYREIYRNARAIKKQLRNKNNH